MSYKSLMIGGVNDFWIWNANPWPGCSGRGYKTGFITAEELGLGYVSVDHIVIPSEIDPVYPYSDTENLRQRTANV